MQFHYKTYCHAKHKPCPRGHAIHNFCRPFLAHHYCILCILNLSDEPEIREDCTQLVCCLINAQEQRRRLFRKYINFTVFTLDSGSCNSQFPVSLSYKCFGKDWPSSRSEEYINARRTTGDRVRTITDANPYQ